MVEFIQQLINGVTLGCIYCLIASGLTLVYGVMYVPNFAQGHLYMVGAYVGFYLLTCVSFNYWLALLGAAVFLGFIGILIEKFLYRPVRDDPHVNAFIVALGLLMVLEGIVSIVWGDEFKEFKSPYGSVLSLGQFVITGQRIFIILGTMVVLVLLNFFLRKTKMGMSVVAMSQNRDLALMVGIDVNRVSSVVFFISTVLAGIAGVLIAPILLVYPSMGFSPLLIAFAAVIFGGLGNLMGAFIGAFIMAITQVLCIHFGAAAFNNIAIFGVMIAVLVFRPTGILGGKE